MKKTDLEAVIEGDFTSKPSIDPGIIEGEINRYSSVDFQKLGRTSDDSDESAIPLAGAVFTVYKANEDGTRGDIAIAKDGTKLENLVTNDEGKLCLADDEGNPNEAVILSLERGNFIFVEVNTPEGYVHPEGESNETLVTVGLIGNDIDVVNIKDEKPTPVTETVLPQAYGLTAYDGGLGSHNNNETGDGPDGQLNDGSEDQLGSSDAATEEKTSSSGDKAGSSLPETSDSLTYVISALLVVVAVSATMGIVAFLRRRDI